jgi:hypothetical protein
VCENVKSTLDQIHVVKQIIESHEFDEDVHLLFVDFNVVYDSVKRRQTMESNGAIGDTKKDNQNYSSICDHG